MAHHAGVERGDLVIHPKYGVGVVLGTHNVELEIRFLRGRGRVDPARVRTALTQTQAIQQLSGIPRNDSAGLTLLRGACLWARSSFPQINDAALLCLSRIEDPSLIVQISEATESWPTKTKVRVLGRLSTLRLEGGMSSWPDAARAALEVLEAEASAIRERRAMIEREARIQRQVQLTNEVRRLRNLVPLTEVQEQSLRKAIERQLASPGGYSNVCWRCGAPVESHTHGRCPECGWLVCLCGSCRSPNWTDRNGVTAGLCKRVMARDS